ncbi:MAG: hypothetical protein ABI400_12410 [Lacisediminihabitans sp.]
MHAVLEALPQGSNAIILPIIMTVAIAAAVLLGIALYVRRQRLAGQLTSVNASASAVSATGVLVSALLISVALGNASIAVAAPVPLVPANNNTVVVLPVPTDLGGIQLPTK